MNYNNKGLFLAFLNREISLIKEKKFSEDEYTKFVKICALSTNGELYASFAQVHELIEDSKNFSALFHELCKLKKINLINGELDFPCFLEKRQEMYHARKDRYKNYYRKQQPLKDIYQRSQKLNTTDHIKNTLQQLTLGHKGANYLQEEHTKILQKNRTFIIDALPDPRIAATFSVYEKQKIEPDLSGARLLGDVSSKIFSQHYMDEHYLISPTGVYEDQFIEDYDHHPFFDVKLNFQYFSKLGLDPLIIDTFQSRVFFEFICNKDFEAFVEVKNMFFNVMESAVRQDIVNPQCNTPYSEFIRNYNFPETNKNAMIEPIVLVEAINLSISKYIGENEHTGITLDQAMKQKINRNKIVIFTATDTEDEILRTEILLSGFKLIGVNYFDDIAFNTYALYDSIHIFHVRTSAGSGGPHGSAIASAKILAMPELDYAISLGICFGVDKDKQKHGDVIVADSIHPYELAAARNGELEFRGIHVGGFIC